MNVIFAADRQRLAEHAAEFVHRAIEETLTPCIGLATGATMELLYQLLVTRYRTGRLSFEGASAVVLDEYVGLSQTDPHAYHQVVSSQLASLVNLAHDRLFGPDGQAIDLDQEALRYDKRVIRSGVGVQLLGIGRNGHIGFNEPGSSLTSRTRVVELTEQTRCDNAGFFEPGWDVPKRAITQGIGTILQSRKLLLLAQGDAKAWAIQAALEGPVTAAVPASAIQLHPDVTVIVDPAAAALLGAKIDQ